MSVASLEMQLALSKLNALVGRMERLEVVPEGFFDAVTEVIQAYRKELIERPSSDEVRWALRGLQSDYASEESPSDADRIRAAVVDAVVLELGQS